MQKLTVTLDPKSRRSLDSLIADFSPFLKSHAIASAALAVGLDVFAREPTKLIEQLRANSPSAQVATPPVER